MHYHAAASNLKQRIAAECSASRKEALVAGCVALLTGRYHEVDDSLLVTLGGDSAGYVLTGREGGKAGYWPRAWAARGLLYAWDAMATDAIIEATADESWRVREMAARVIGRHRLADAFAAIDRLRGDGVPRVRAAAEKAIARLTATGAWRLPDALLASYLASYLVQGRCSIPTVWCSSQPCSECSDPPSEGRCGSIQLVAGQISDGCDSIAEIAAAARHQVEIRAASIAALVRMTEVVMRRS
jgi:hypothetical protein